MRTAHRIRRARRHAKLSQVQLSATISVQRSAVSNWESANEIYPTMANLIAIARACDVSLEWLGTGRGGMLLSGLIQAETPAADAELVDAPHERELLAVFRSLSQRSQELILELTSKLAMTHRRGRRAKHAATPGASA